MEFAQQSTSISYKTMIFYSKLLKHISLSSLVRDKDSPEMMATVSSMTRVTGNWVLGSVLAWHSYSPSSDLFTLVIVMVDFRQKDSPSV